MLEGADSCHFVTQLVVTRAAEEGTGDRGRPAEDVDTVELGVSVSDVEVLVPVENLRVRPAKRDPADKRPRLVRRVVRQPGSRPKIVAGRLRKEGSAVLLV